MKEHKKERGGPSTNSDGGDALSSRSVVTSLEALPPVASGTLIDVLVRLEATLTAEVVTLQSGSASDMSRFIDEKSRFLLYLECLAHSRSVKLTPEQGARVERVQAALEKNLSALRNHVLAARDVMKTVTDCVEAARSDGTYGRLQTVER